MPSIVHNSLRSTAWVGAYSTSTAPRLAPSSSTLKAAESSVYKALMALASRPAYGVTLALAGTVTHSWQMHGVRYLPLYGVDADATCRVLSNHFPGINRMLVATWDELQAPRVFEEANALTEMVEMLVQHRTVLDEDSTCLAHAIATSCLGSDELWRDMNLASPAVLDDLLHGFFTVFAARNRTGQTWKAFLQRELSERAARRLSRGYANSAAIS